MCRSNRSETSRAETDQRFCKNPGGAPPDAGPGIRKKRLEAIQAASERFEVSRKAESGP